MLNDDSTINELLKTRQETRQPATWYQATCITAGIAAIIHWSITGVLAHLTPRTTVDFGVAAWLALGVGLGAVAVALGVGWLAVYNTNRLHRGLDRIIDHRHRQLINHLTGTSTGGVESQPLGDTELDRQQRFDWLARIMQNPPPNVSSIDTPLFRRTGNHSRIGG